MKFTLLLNLLPGGKFARVGYYNRPSKRTLRFDIEISRRICRDYETLEQCTIDTFSLCGSRTKTHGGDQGIEDIVTQYRDRVPRDKLSDFDKLIEMWRKYHLNDMLPGTKKQEEALSEWRKTNHYDYRAACEFLDSIGLLTDGGYQYGSGWLGKPILKDDIAFIHRICKEWSEDDA